ncbi:hypothetical protein [Variovorax soli]|uniref:Uncharacterized protein n=1 Tax=Variovorax soli TaxID=376815 RepID=A0ABU1NG56_9BURK|nr:hypothetical protein [Variovorax soli]MDR6537292.1 hypothetical protein [Variovorax soli]
MRSSEDSEDFESLEVSEDVQYWENVEQIQTEDTEKKSALNRERAQKLLIHLQSIPDVFLDDLEGSEAEFLRHTTTTNELIASNLDADSIWEFVFLAGNMRESMKAKLLAKRRLEADPKQGAKKQVRELWDLWQKDPSRYRGKAAFARDMLEKFESLTNQRVIERWCQSWESVPF